MEKMFRRLTNNSLEEVSEGDEDFSVTRQSIIDAIALGGYAPLKKAMLHDDEEGKIIAACPMGMGALNLGASFPSFKAIFDDILWIEVTSMNDFQGKTNRQVARRIKSDWKNKLSEKVTLKRFDWGQEYTNYGGVKVT